ncbi:MAG: LysE family translocator [Pseudomonadota bacterium]
MDWSQVVAFAVVAGLLVMSPGPNGLLIAKTVPMLGRSAGFANIAGFVAAFYLHGALSIFGISLLLVRSAEAFFIVKMIGAGYLCWLGFKALRDAWQGHDAGPNSTASAAVGHRKVNLGTAFMEGFLTNALNPKVSMFYLAAFPQFIPTGSEAVASAFLLVVVHSLINLVWFTLIVLLFARLTQAVSNGRFQRWLKGVTGAVFVGFGVKLASYQP